MTAITEEDLNFVRHEVEKTYPATEIFPEMLNPNSDIGWYLRFVGGKTKIRVDKDGYMVSNSSHDNEEEEEVK